MGTVVNNSHNNDDIINRINVILYCIFKPLYIVCNFWFISFLESSELWPWLGEGSELWLFVDIVVVELFICIIEWYKTINACVLCINDNNQ